MKSKHAILLFSLLIISMITSFQVGAASIDKKKSAGNNGESQRAYQEAVKALKDQIFLVSIYSFVDKAGNVAGIEPEGNFITVSKGEFMMQKSASLILNTFPGSGNIKGQLADFQIKENKKGNIQFSFGISEGEKIFTFKGKMSKGDNTIEGSIKGKKEEREIYISGNVQPLKSHFEY